MMALHTVGIREQADRIRRAADRMVQSISIMHLPADAMTALRMESNRRDVGVDPAALRLYSFPRGFRQR